MQQVKVHIKKNDMVVVMKGKDRGKSGRVLRLFPKKGKAIVEKLNFVKRHARPSQKMRQGGIIEKESPLAVSNLMILCPRCNRPVRVGRKMLEDGGKVRICRKCGDVLDK